MENARKCTRLAKEPMGKKKKVEQPNEPQTNKKKKKKKKKKNTPKKKKTPKDGKYVGKLRKKRQEGDLSSRRYGDVH